MFLYIVYVIINLNRKNPKNNTMSKQANLRNAVSCWRQHSEYNANPASAAAHPAHRGMFISES